MTDIARFAISRGVKDIKDMGRILSVNNVRWDSQLFLASLIALHLSKISTQSVWDGDECNKFVGTDSTVFPPFLKPEEGIWAFTPDICMSVQAHYVRKSSFAGIPTSVYTIDFGDFKVNEFVSSISQIDDCYSPI